MLINNGFTAIAPIGVQRPDSLSVYHHLNVPALPQDILHISEEAQQKISQLQQGDQSLQQAVTQSRQAIRGAAQERIASAKEYLKILIRLSPAGDKGAAHEAARITREVKSAANEFKGSIADEDGVSVNSEIAGFVGVAGDVLKMAKSLIESYLQKRQDEQRKDKDLKKDINDAFSTLREISSSTGYINALTGRNYKAETAVINFPRYLIETLPGKN